MFNKLTFVVVIFRSFSKISIILIRSYWFGHVNNTQNKFEWKQDDKFEKKKNLIVSTKKLIKDRIQNIMQIYFPWISKII